MPYEVKHSVMDAMRACQNIMDYTAGLTLEIYQGNSQLRHSVERACEILGEAFKRIEKVDPSFRERFPEMGDIIGMRNRLIHGYDVVDEEVVWRTAEENIPALADKLAAWLEENP